MENLYRYTCMLQYCSWYNGGALVKFTGPLWSTPQTWIHILTVVPVTAINFKSGSHASLLVKKLPPFPWTSKNPPKIAQLCEGVQTSPYSVFMCGLYAIPHTQDKKRAKSVCQSYITLQIMSKMALFLFCMHLQPKNYYVCRGLQNKVCKWVSYTRLLVLKANQFIRVSLIYLHWKM